MFDLSNNVDFGLVLLAGDRRVIQFNRWLRARAQIAAEPVGGTLEAAFGMPMNLRLQAAVEHALDRGQSSRLSSALNPSPLPLYDEGKDGQRIRQAVDVSPIDLEDGRRACLLQVRDVSETHRREALFKRQAQLLEKSERRLMATLENAPSGMAMCALNGHWTYSNRAVELILGYPRSTLVGRPVESLVHPDDLAMHMDFQHAALHGSDAQAQTEERWRHAGGHFVWVRVCATRVGGAVDEPSYLIVQFDSIDDRKREAVQIANALAEKETLLREVYHRVKNNLQVIQSLLNLKRRSVSDLAAREALSETAERVRSMALVHEKLYQSSRLTSIDLSEYLRDLVDQLKSALGSSARSIDIELVTQSLQADLNTAIPFGLIVTELVSNCLKHAFRERGGRVRIELGPGPIGARLLIADNGVGLPESFATSNIQSLGLRLVTSLARQLDGHCDITHDNGVRAELNFKGVLQAGMVAAGAHAGDARPAA